MAKSRTESNSNGGHLAFAGAVLAALIMWHGENAAVKLDHELTRQEKKELEEEDAAPPPAPPAPTWWPVEQKSDPKIKRTEMPSSWNERKQSAEKKKVKTGPFPVWE